MLRGKFSVCGLGIVLGGKDWRGLLRGVCLRGFERVRMLRLESGCGGDGVVVGFGIVVFWVGWRLVFWVRGSGSDGLELSGLWWFAGGCGGAWRRLVSVFVFECAGLAFRFVSGVFAGFGCFERCVWVLLVSVAAFEGFLGSFVSDCGWVRGFAELAGLSFSVGGVAQKSFKSFHNGARIMRCTFLFGRGRKSSASPVSDWIRGRSKMGMEAMGFSLRS